MTATLLRRSAVMWRRESGRAVLRASVQVMRARWQLRRATCVGAARLWGRARLFNAGVTIIEDRVRLDGTIVPIDLACGPGAVLRIGEGTYINYGTSIGAIERVDIGRECKIGQYSIIMDSDQHDPGNPAEPGRSAPVVIEDGAWLGARVTVLKGVTIGAGAVVGAHAVVTTDVPPRTLAAGVPARVIRSLEQ